MYHAYFRGGMIFHGIYDWIYGAAATRRLSAFFSEPYNSNVCFLIGNGKTRSHDVLTPVPRCPPNPRNLTYYP